jgi:hypothetical protein
MQGKQSPLVAYHREEISHQIGTDVQLWCVRISIYDNFRPVVDVIGRDTRQAQQKLRVVGLIGLVRGQRSRKGRGRRAQPDLDGPVTLL